MKLYIGLDLSLNATGVAGLGGTSDTPWGSATLSYKPPKAPKGEKATIKGYEIRRLIWLRDQVCDFVSNATSQIPDHLVIAMEGYAFSAQVAHSQGELGGVIRTALVEMGLGKVTMVAPPTTLKKFVTGKGNAPKSEMMKQVYKRWGFDCKSDDEADAYSLAQFARSLDTKSTLADKVSWLEKK